MSEGNSDEAVLTERRRGRQIALLTLALVAAFALLGFALWRDRQQEDPLATMVSAFRKQNRLTVFQAQIATVVTSASPRLFGLLDAEQVGVIPATVEYRLDLGSMDGGNFDWDPDEQHMRVTLPPLLIAPPNLDERRARYFRQGVLISGTTQEALTRSNSQAAQAEAVREARNPQLLALARAAAKEAMEQNVSVPLRAAGYKNVLVEVRFADEPQQGASYLDASRRPEDVLKEREASR